MTALKRRLNRTTGTRPLRKKYVISSEGDKTEPRYFAWFNQRKEIHVEILRSKDESAPEQVLEKMKSHLKNAKYDKPYEAWLIVDKDHWQNQQLEPLHQWSIQREYYHLAVSNPNFEYWLLLHLEDGKGVSTKAECDTKLKRHIPDYSKSNFDMSKLEPGISEAIKRAESKDRPPCEKWPEKTGTTVYLLVKKLHQD